MKHSNRARSAHAVSWMAGAVLGLVMAWQIAVLSGGLLLVLTCALAVASVTQDLVARLITRHRHYRCAAPNCTFAVRMTDGFSAAEARRWEEIAAAHPEHDYRR